MEDEDGAPIYVPTHDSGSVDSLLQKCIASEAIPLVSACANAQRSLCKHCQYAFDNWEDIAKDELRLQFPHCEHIFALQDSATRGCALCGQFLSNLDLLHQEQLDIARIATTRLFNKGVVPQRLAMRIVSFNKLMSNRRPALLDYRLLRLTITSGYEGMGHPRLETKELLSEFSFPEFDSNVILMPVLDPDTALPQNCKSTSANTEDSLWLARTWLQNCIKAHHACVNSTKYVPTRLLCLEDEKVRLCESSSLDASTPYATLSHCWGSIEILQLTTRNINLLLMGIPAGCLCKTFQDAIQITRQLGLQYIWIDSLCIVQDDPQDWNAESGRMSAVYGGSTINIAATSASDGNGGCFFERSMSNTWRHRITTSTHGQQRYYDCIDDGVPEVCLFKTPLATRAWVIQERLLAPRTLQFSKMQLFWECNSVTACESFPNEFPKALMFRESHLLKQPISKSSWPEIVNLYSRCELTYDKDKLIAIAGIAQVIHARENHEDAYFAGLWRRDIESQLCWIVRKRIERVVRPRAPSWSWASVDGAIDYGLSAEGRFAYSKVFDVDIGLQDPFGEVAEGRISLGCDFLFWGTFDRSPRRGHVRNARQPWDQMRFGSNEQHVRTYLDDSGMEPEEAFMLPIIEGINTYTRAKTRCLRGLLVCSTGRRGEYTSIGYFEYDGFEDIKNKLTCQVNDSGYTYDHPIKDDVGHVWRIITIV